MDTLRPDTRRITLLAAALTSVAFLALGAPALAAPSLEAFALSVGGNSQGGSGGCGTFMSAAPVFAWFNDGLSIPLDGLTACGVPGGFDDLTQATGPISRSRSLTSAWSDVNYTGSSVANANYGDFSATANALYTGTTSPTFVCGTEGMGVSQDTFTLTSPSVPDGQTGTIQFTLTVTGGLSTNANATVTMAVHYRIGGAIYSMFRSQANNSFTNPSLSSLPGADLSGLTVTPGALSGTAQAPSFAHVIKFGTPFTLDFATLALVIPGTGTITAQSHFHAYVSHIEVRGPLGQLLPDVKIVTASGTPYSVSGLLAVGDGAAREDVRLAAAPNPSATATRLTFTLAQAARVTLVVHDAAGRVVRTLAAAQDLPAGAQSMAWDGRDDRGTRLPLGTYFARLRAGATDRTTRVTLVR
jgi:hypothetical protein